MEQIWKQFAAWATAFEHNLFLRARLKLTAIYVAIVGVILSGFSVLLYSNIARNLLDASDEDFAGAEFHQHFVDMQLSHLQTELIIIDLVILAIAAIVSYVLAAYTLQPIQHSLEAQRKFSENASHELRTPLTVMKNDIEVLLRNPHPTKELIHSTLQSAVEEINGMSRLAEDLLLIARSQNKTSIASKHVYFSELVRRVVDKMHAHAVKKGVQLGVTTDASLYIVGDEHKLERVLTNLIQNAIDHTPEKSSISVAAHKVSNSIVLRVSDTGTGIGEKDLPHVFERFYKGEGSHGNGLGLSIVKELVHEHEGSIEVESTTDQGTVIKIELPSV